MANDLIRITGDLELSALLADTTGGKTFARTFGAQGIPTLDIAVSTFGTGSGECNWLYYASRSVGATTADNFDLAGSLTDAFGTTITATKLKVLVVAIDSPDGTKKLRVGPRGVANAAQLCFGGTGATDYIEVFDWLVLQELVAGWTITGGSADIVGVYNSGAGSVTYSILMAGV